MEEIFIIDCNEVSKVRCFELFVCLFVCLSVCLSVCLFKYYLLIYCKIKCRKIESYILGIITPGELLPLTHIKQTLTLPGRIDPST